MPNRKGVRTCWMGLERKGFNKFKRRSFMETRPFGVLSRYFVFGVILLIFFFLPLTFAIAEQVVISPGKVDAPSFRTSSANLYGTLTDTHINLGQYSLTGDLQESMPYCTVGGGFFNWARRQGATVGGGFNNEAHVIATVAGGSHNIAKGEGAAICGGASNEAGGDYSWAGGKYMQLTDAAGHTFVWGYAEYNDKQTIPTADAFLIFPGGTKGNVGIGTAAPVEKVHIREKSATLGAAILLDSTGGTGGRQYYVGSTLSSNIGGAGLFQIYDDTADQVRLNINAAGNVGIGTANIDFKLEVNGTAGKTDGGVWSVSSDERLKEVAGPYERGLEQIMGLRPIRFFYKKDNPRGLPSGEEFIGFIAQEAREVFPESVSEGPDGYLNFNMHSVNVAVINAIQELNAQVERIQVENAALRVENKNLRQDLEMIKKALGL